jgi:WXG100 family type VII secretion target
MPTSISVVQASQPDRLAHAAAQAGQSASRVEQQLTAGRQALARMRAGWEGAASDAASASAERTFVRQQKIAGALQRMQSALSSGGGQLSGTRTAIVDNVTRLEQVGYQVADDGTVSVKPGSPLEQLAKMSPASAMQIQAATAELGATSTGAAPASFKTAGPSGWEWDDDDENNDIDPGPDPGGARGANVGIGIAPVSFSSHEPGHWEEDHLGFPIWMPALDPDADDEPW